MKLTKKQLAEPFDIDLYKNDLKVETNNLNQKYIALKTCGFSEFGGLLIQQDKTIRALLALPTNAHFIWIADALGIIDKNEWL